MRQRALLEDGDYSFGTGAPFLVNSPTLVAQAVMQRLRLNTGEWFLDSQEGLPLEDQILGHNTALTRDLAIRVRILDTQGVQRISEYMSYLDSDRGFVVLATIDTVYGAATIATSL